jgi:hypothetical protein
MLRPLVVRDCELYIVCELSSNMLPKVSLIIWNQTRMYIRYDVDRG